MKRSRDGLYRRGGVFAFRYQYPVGHWREKYTGQTGRIEARTFRDDFLAKLHNEDLPNEKSAWTVERAATRWVEQHSARLGSAKAKRNEKSLLKQLIAILGSRKLKAITLDDLKDYQRKRRQKVGPRAINLELRILSNTLKEANCWRAIEKHYKPLTEQESEVGHSLTAQQLDLLERTAARKESWLVALCAELLCSSTGMRGIELKQLQLGAVDLENRRIHIHRGVTKTNAGQRLIELNAVATAAVTKLYARAQTLGSKEPTHYLLPADLSRHTQESDPLNGKRGFDVTMHQESWRTSWRNLREATAKAVEDAALEAKRELTSEERKTILQLRTLRFHNLRHTFISMMAERGIPLPVTMAMVGHMSPAMTRHYTHISNKAAREAVELLDNPERVRFVGNLVGAPGAAAQAVSKSLN
jgi:integrase